MPLLRHCNTGRTCTFAITHYHKKADFPTLHVVQKITIIRAQKIGKSAI